MVYNETPTERHTMLTEKNIQDINNQIASELRTVGRYTPSNEEKLAALDRIARLKALLDEDVTPTTTFDQVPSAKPNYTFEDLGHDIRELARALTRR